MPDVMLPRLSFRLGSAVELSLLLLAGLVAWIFHLPLFADLHWNMRDVLVGLAAAVPLLIGFRYLLVSPVPGLRRIRDFLEVVVRPAMREWTMLQLAMISALAGLCEEVLFRAVLQGGLGEVLGTWGALLVASVMFGLCHWITRTYALLAGLIGLYLGWLWLLSGNLLVPIVTHAIYDFVALTWFLRMRDAGGRGAN